jgi:prephenate dehydrogenase
LKWVLLKLSYAEAVTNHPKEGIYRNTIAGTEFSGPSAYHLFQGKTNIICEVERTAFKLQEKALDLLKPSG